MSVKKETDPGVEGRIEAARRLIRIHDEGAFADLIGGRTLSPPAERVATHLVGGVVRWRLWLDHLLRPRYRGRFEDLEPMLRELLRIGAYDLAVAGTAPHAAVHQAVEATNISLRKGAGKLVNAVLRALDRARPWEKDSMGDSVQELSVRWSHPDWMVRRWLARFGAQETQKLLAHNNAPPVYSLRLSKDRERFQEFLEAEHVPWTPSRFLDDYIQVERLQPVIGSAWLNEGTVAVQDESAGLVVRLLDPQPGECIVDGCAAPGGKARYVRERMGGRGRLVAIDASASRLARLPDDIEVEAADFRDWAGRHPDVADRVLVDVPCTGLGVLSGRPDLRWRRDESDFEKLRPLQAGLLDAAARAVRPGGVVVYATCSMEPEENHGQARDFLARNDSFVLERAGRLPPEVVDEEGFLATLPHRHGIDGAFGARFRRRG